MLAHRAAEAERLRKEEELNPWVPPSPPPPPPRAEPEGSVDVPEEADDPQLAAAVAASRAAEVRALAEAQAAQEAAERAAADAGEVRWPLGGGPG